MPVPMINPPVETHMLARWSSRVRGGGELGKGHIAGAGKLIAQGWYDRAGTNGCSLTGDFSSLWI